MIVRVKVPATSANLGSGFDCVGVALNLYNYVEVEESNSGLEIVLPENDKNTIPTDERNLVYKSIIKVYKKANIPIPGLKIRLTNNIPVTRGLGSSSAGIVGGLFAANLMLGNLFQKDELMNMSAEIEGHPDNVIPAITGGLTVSVIEDNKVFFVNNKLDEDLTFAVFVPDFLLATKLSRSKLPGLTKYQDATFNIGRAALLVSSFITGKYENLNCATKDRLHQSYRMGLIKGASDLFNKIENAGALGKYISGAGPSIVAILKGNEISFKKDLSKDLEKNFPGWKLFMLKVDNLGVQIGNDQNEVIKK